MFSGQRHYTGTPDHPNQPKYMVKNATTQKITAMIAKIHSIVKVLKIIN